MLACPELENASPVCDSYKKEHINDLESARRAIRSVFNNNRNTNSIGEMLADNTGKEEERFQIDPSV